MSRDRVIQDSDDEDDPLCEAMGPPSKNPPGQDASTRTQDDPSQETSIDNNSTATHDTNGETTGIDINTITEDIQDAVVDYDGRVSGSQPGVNFDDFLQSPEDGRAQLTLSQQGREGIMTSDNNSGITRLGSIGAVMTEINLAQKRLLDDEASCRNGGQQLYPGSVQGEPLQYVTPFTYKQGSSQDVTYQSNNHGPKWGLGQLASNEDFHSELFREPEVEAPGHGLIHGGAGDDGDINGHCYGDNITVQNASHDFNQSPVVYNFFETSLSKGSVDHSSAENDALLTRPNEDAQSNELHGTPFRSKSLQTTPYSPHDTEPMSSLISPTLNRAKSSNATVPALQQAGDRSLSQKSIHDEPSIEIPIVKKGIDNENQDVVLNEEDDELALTDAHKVQSETEKQMEPENVPEVGDTAGRDAAISEKGMQQEMSIGEAPARSPKVSPPAIPEVQFAVPAKPEPKTRESKKKKLKRGKTTSVTLKKTYEPDVEDDVIWIDERHSHSESQNKWNLDDIPFLPKPSSKSIIGSAKSQAEPGLSDPKKRGRKRKKTSEQQQVQPNTSVADNSPIAIQYGQEDLNNHTQIEKLEPLSHSVHCEDKNTSDNTHEINSFPNHNRDQGGGQETYGTDHQNEKEKAPDNAATQHEPPYLSDLTEYQNQQSSPVNKETKQITTDSSCLASEGKQQYQQQQQGDLNKHPYRSEHLSGADTDTDTTALKSGNGVPGKDPRKGPDKHSPITATSRTPFRVGLSRKARVAPLLKSVKR